MGSSASFHLTFKPEAEGVLRDRWSDRSPQEGTEECVCSWCGKMIGHDDRDPVWKDHIKWCAGCEVCEIALRMWKDDPNKQGEVLELRFHPKCISEIIVPKNGT